MSKRLRIAFISDSNSWKNPYIRETISALRRAGHRLRWVHRIEDIPAGDLLFIIGCTKIILPRQLRRNTHNLVVHESALPKGRGWSPMSWQVIRGAKAIPITLIEAAERVDSGVIYLQGKVPLRGDELLPELREATIREILTLVRDFVRGYPGVLRRARPQKGASSYFPPRSPKDSRLDPAKPLKDQFNLLRIVDNDAYPAFFELRGRTYTLRIEQCRS